MATYLRTRLLAAAAAVAMLAAPASAASSTSVPGAVADVLRLLTTKSADEVLEAASKTAAKHTDEYAKKYAELAKEQGEDAARAIMEEWAPRYHRSVIDRLSAQQRALIEHRARLSAAIHDDLRLERLGKEEFGVPLTGIQYLIRSKLVDEVTPNTMEYIKTVMAMAKMDRIAQKYAKQSGKSLPVTLRATPEDKKMLEILTLFRDRLKKLGGKAWRAQNGNLMSVSQNQQANRVLAALKAGSTDSLSVYEKKLLAEVRDGAWDNTKFGKHAKAADPGPAKAPHRVADAAEYGDDASGALRKELDRAATAAADPAAVKRAISELAGPVDAPMSSEAFVGLRNTLKRAETLRDGAGAEHMVKTLTAEENQLVKLADQRIEKLMGPEHAVAFSEKMPLRNLEGRPYDNHFKRWTAHVRRDQKVAALLEDAEVMVRNGKMAAEYAKKLEHAKHMLSLAREGSIKPPGWFKSSERISGNVQEYLAKQVEALKKTQSVIDRYLKLHQEFYVSSAVKPETVRLNMRLNSNDDRVLRLIRDKADEIVSK